MLFQIILVTAYGVYMREQPEMRRILRVWIKSKFAGTTNRQVFPLSVYQNNLQLHVDSQVMCDSLWYLMCLSARIRRPLETWDNTIKCQDADAIFRNMSDIYVTVLLHYYLQWTDALVFKGMPLSCSTEP